MRLVAINSPCDFDRTIENWLGWRLSVCGRAAYWLERLAPGKESAATTDERVRRFLFRHLVRSAT